jgi:perosamine synthetase
MMTNDFPRQSTFYFWKGRVALFGILKALGIGPGDEVVVPGFTCVVVPQAVRFTGARPIYVDIRGGSVNLDPALLPSVLTSRTKAVIVQHTFGIPADVDAIVAATAPRDIPIVEDCAHCMGATYHGHGIGTFGNAAFFSTQWTKPVTTGLGGIATAKDPELAKKLEAFYRSCVDPQVREELILYLQYAIHRLIYRPSVYWFARSLLHALTNAGICVGSSTRAELNGSKPADYDKRMAGLQMRVLKGALLHLRSSCMHRQDVAKRYREALMSIGLPVLDALPDTEPVYLRYPTLVNDKQRLLREAQRLHIEIGDWFVSPVHPLTNELWKVGYDAGACPVAEDLARHIINLPTHSKVNNTTISRICDFVMRGAT